MNQFIQKVMESRKPNELFYTLIYIYNVEPVKIIDAIKTSQLLTTNLFNIYGSCKGIASHIKNRYHAQLSKHNKKIKHSALVEDYQEIRAALKVDSRALCKFSFGKNELLHITSEYHLVKKLIKIAYKARLLEELKAHMIKYFVQNESK